MSALAAITEATTPSGRGVGEPMLDDEAPDRVAEAGEHHREAAEQRRREPPRSSPSSSATPATPTPTPTRRSPSERSSWSTRIASSAVKIGVEATRIPASAEAISCSPTAISRNGPATWTAPTSAMIAEPAPQPAERALAAAIGIEHDRRERDPRERHHRRRQVAEPDLDEHVAGAPDRGEEQQPQPRAAVHGVEASYPGG